MSKKTAKKSTAKRSAHPRAAGVRAKPSAPSPAAAGPDIATQVASALTTLKRLSSPRVKDDMGKRYGIIGTSAENALGVPMAGLKLLATQLRKQGGDGRHRHDLADALWRTDLYEARMVACMVDDPTYVTSAQMDRWTRDFDNWAICDTVCFKLFDQVDSELSLPKVDRWALGSAGLKGGNDEFVTRAAFALLACVALHDKQTPDRPFVDRLPLIERAALDERNFVKKGVSWALRGVGRRNAGLHAAAVELARRLAASPNAAASWVGRDVLKDLTKPAVVRLVANAKRNPRATRRG